MSANDLSAGLQGLSIQSSPGPDDAGNVHPSLRPKRSMPRFNHGSMNSSPAPPLPNPGYGSVASLFAPQANYSTGSSPQPQGRDGHSPPSASARFERLFGNDYSSPPPSQMPNFNNFGPGYGVPQGGVGPWTESLSGTASPSQGYGQPSESFFPPSQPGSGFMGAVAQGNDEVIPTAIVIKNISFSVQKEQLLQIIEDLHIPIPYAFNYHYDNGVFRGLAFANFRSSEEADAVVAALNGYDVAGRKLRVEYKKVLQAGEKERIEKEKAIKRMQSMQLEKERQRQAEAQGQGQYATNFGGAHSQGPSSDALTDDGYSNTSAFSGSVPLTAASLRGLPAAMDGFEAGALSDKSGGGGSKKDELDMNDQQTLEIYSRVLLFKDDRMRDELAFSKTLSPLERRTVHLVAQKLGLYHYSMGEGEERCVVVTKNAVPQSEGRSLRPQASTIGRSGRLDPNGLLASENSPYGNFLGTATTGRSGLRMKKSAPDMKRERDTSYTYSNSPSGHLAPGSSASLAGRRSNSNLRDGYSVTVGRRPQAGGIGGAAGLASMFNSPFGEGSDVPPVPLLPPSFDVSNNSTAGAANLVRQPRGPPAAGSPTESRNFAVRSRVQVSSNNATGSAHSDEATPSSEPGYTDGAGGMGRDDNLNVQSHEPLEF